MQLQVQKRMRTIRSMKTRTHCVAFALELEMIIIVLGIVTNLITTMRGLSGNVQFKWVLQLVTFENSRYCSLYLNSALLALGA